MTHVLLPPRIGRRLFRALLFAAALTVGGCADRAPTGVNAPAQPRLESAPMPANAVLLDLEDLDYPNSSATWLMRAGTNPRVDFVSFWRENSHEGSDGRVSVSPRGPPSVPTMYFSQPLARLTMYVLGIHGATIRCHDRDGRELAVGDVPDVRWGLDGWTTLDFQGEGIISCTMQGYAFIDSMRLLPMPQNQLKLTCTGDLGENRVTRGERIECVAKKNPESASGQLTITSWSFEGEQRVDTPVDAPTWGGPMVRSGTVTVKARIGTGTEMTAVAPITVVARDWSGKVPTITPQRVKNGHLAFDVPLPTAVVWAHDLGHATVKREAEQPSMIGEGPNRDYSYLPDLLLRFTQYYAVNEEALAPNSQFTLVQEANANNTGSGIRISVTNWCQQRDVPRQDRRIEEHELAHGTVFGEKLLELLKPELERLEALTGKSDDAVTGPLDAFLTTAEETAGTTAEDIVDDPKGRYAVSFVDSSGRACLMKNVQRAELRNKPKTSN